MLSLKAWLVSGLVSVLLAAVLVSQYRTIKLQGTQLTETRTTVSTLTSEMTAWKLRQEQITEKLAELDSRKQEFSYGLKEAVAKDTKDAADAVPAAVVDSLCAYLRCRPVQLNGAGR